jgi:hypothetical protein
MNPYRFEIVRWGGRFGWIFVRIDDRGRRVLAVSERSYRRKKRVKDAIAALREAGIVDMTKKRRGYQLPDTSFEYVSGVVPLIVDESPGEELDRVYAVSIDEAAAAGDEEEVVSAAVGADEEKAVSARRQAARPRARAKAT